MLAFFTGLPYYYFQEQNPVVKPLPQHGLEATILNGILVFFVVLVLVAVLAIVVSIVADLFGGEE